jgi:adenylate cyclase
VEQIAKELGVDYVLESSLRGSADHFRVTSQLIRLPDQVHVWAKQYDRQARDLITLDDDIGWSVAKEVKIRLQPLRTEGTVRQQPENAEAYEFYLRARYAWNKGRQILCGNGRRPQHAAVLWLRTRYSCC